jgi:DNA-binding transcriptional LysR family regulator
MSVAMHDIDTALLRTFVSLAETLNFSRTANRIGRSQSAVSAQVKKLEDLFSLRLIERDTRNVALTPDGERLLVHARQMVAAADAMLERFGVAEVAGEVRFGSPEDFASAYLPDALAAFAQAHPKVMLYVSCELTLRLVAQVETGDLDVVIVKQDGRLRHPAAKPLWREELVWVGCEDHGGRDPSQQPLPLALVAAPAPCVYRSRAIEALDAAHVPWRIVFESPSFAGCAAAVRAGLGVSVMPHAMVPPGLIAMATTDGWPPLPEAEICILGQARLTPAAQALATYLESRITRHRSA